MLKGELTPLTKVYDDIAQAADIGDYGSVWRECFNRMAGYIFGVK